MEACALEDYSSFMLTGEKRIKLRSFTVFYITIIYKIVVSLRHEKGCHLSGGR